MLVVVDEKSDCKILLDTDDMSVNTSTLDELNELEDSGVIIAGNMPFGFNILEYSVSKDYNELCKNLFEDFKFKVSINWVVKTPLQINLLHLLDSQKLYNEFIKLYMKRPIKPTLINDAKHPFNQCIYFIYKNNLYLTDGKDLVYCDTRALDEYTDNYTKLTKASILQHLEPHYFYNSLCVSGKYERLVLYSGLIYQLEDYSYINELVVQNNTNLVTNNVGFYVKKITYLQTSPVLLRKLIRDIKFYGDFTVDVYCYDSVKENLNIKSDNIHLHTIEGVVIC